MNDKLYKQEFFVKGMHCAMCELYVEKNIGAVKGIEKVDVKLNSGKIFIESSTEYTPEKLSEFIKEGGYSIVENVGNGNNPKAQSRKDLILSALIAFAIMAAFLLLQKLDIINLVNTDKITLPFVFLIGITASLSTCMAVVGGLVLSISSTLSQNKNYKPMITFHIGRLVGFFVLGGFIGLIGSAFIITPVFSLILNLFLFFVMLIMALNLLELSPNLAKYQIRMPKSIGMKVMGNKNNSMIGTALLGMLTFILPCGFTQSMQIYSLSTGSFLTGALTMFVFALGTLPVLSFISFASVKMSKISKSGMFFKVAGFLVIMFAIFNLYSSLKGLGVF